nr:peptidoglycan DD-metalloendopeptidase family protein [uncultured Porphyromonas sp.]
MMHRPIPSLLLGLALLMAAPSLAEAQQSRTLRRLEQERKQLLKNIAASDRKLQELRKSTKQQEHSLKLVQEQVAQRKQVVSVLGSEISGLEQQIGSLTGRISQLHREESGFLQRYSEALRQLQRIDAHIDPMIFVLSSSSTGQARERQRFLSRYVSAVRRASEGLRDTRSRIEHTKQEVGRTHAAKEQLLSLRVQEQKKLESQEQQQQASVKELKGQQQQLAQDLSKQRQRAEELDRRIQQQVEAEIRAAQQRAEAQRRRQEEARRRREAAQRAARPTIPRDKPGQSQPAEQPVERPRQQEDVSDEPRRAATPGGYAMDANERALASSFEQNKGRLPAPIRGAYSLLRTFGVHQHSQHSRVQVSSSGVDFGLRSAGQAYAVFSGVVSRIFVIPGYGTSIILRHGNYLTVYANLSSISVSQGARVATGQALGSIGAAPDGSSDRLLHFQLWHERTKLNPLSWIRR